MSKKVLSLVLALVMVLGSFSFVSAAKYDDVTGTEFEAAVDRLSLLEVLEGFPDGTFKPNDTITRAQFAAVAVRAKGLADAAAASKGLPTGFTDVYVGHWAEGFITTAAKLGVVNGVGHGLFAPEAPVKYEEAVTMMVRALGYEAAAQTKGGYPYGYLIVANEIGLLDEVTKGVQGTPASRGVVAQIADNALEIPKMIQVGFGSETKWVVSGSKEHGTDAEAQYLLHDLGIEEIKGYVTNNFRTKNTVKKNEVEIDGTKYKTTDDVDTDALLGAGVTAWAKDDVVFSASIGFKFKRAGVDYEFTKDQIVYDRIVAEDTNEDEAYLYKLDDEYEWASRARIFVNNEDDVDAEDIQDGAYGRFVLNEEDKIEFAYLFSIDAADTGLVREIDDKDLEYVNGNADEDVLALDDAEEIYVFNEELSKASLEDIKEDSAVFFWVDSDDNYYIIVSNETLEGTLEAVRVRDNRITVDGTNAKVINSIFSTNGGEDFEPITNTVADFEDIEDYVDENVVVYHKLGGDVLAIVTDADAVSSKVYGIATWLTNQRNPVLSVYTAEGKEVDYTFEERDDIAEFDNTNFSTTNIVGVYFEVNKDGEIKDGTLEVVSSEDNTKLGEFTKTDKNKYGEHTKVSGNLYITEDTVVLKAVNSNKLKPSVIKYENIINKTIGSTDNNEAIVMTSKGRDLGLIVFTENSFQAVDEAEFGIITSDPVRRGSDYRAEIHVFGEGKDTYTISDLDDAKLLAAGDLIEFKLNDKGEVVLEDYVDLSADRDDDTEYKVVEDIDGNYITTEDGSSYRRSSSTIFYSATRKGALGNTSTYGRIEEGSIILVVADGEELKAVIDITAYRATKTDDNDNDNDNDNDLAGNYVINDYLVNFNTPRLVLADISAEEVTMNIADFEGYKIGALEVTEEVMNAWLADNWDATEVYVDVTEDNELVVDEEYAAALEDVTAVAGVTVAIGTPEADALAELATETTIVDEYGMEFTVAITWNDITTYDPDVASDYTANGTLDLPAVVTGLDAITATVTVE